MAAALTIGIGYSSAKALSFGGPAIADANGNTANGAKGNTANGTSFLGNNANGTSFNGNGNNLDRNFLK